LTPLYSNIGDNGRIWFSGRMNKNTGEIISHHFGRMNQQYQGQNHQHGGEDIDSTNIDGIDEL